MAVISQRRYGDISWCRLKPQTCEHYGSPVRGGWDKHPLPGLFLPYGLTNKGRPRREAPQVLARIAATPLPCPVCERLMMFSLNADGRLRQLERSGEAGNVRHRNLEL